MSAQTISKYDKLNKKLKQAIKTSKKAEDDVEIRHTLKRGNLGSRIFQSGSHGNVDSAYNLKRKRTYGQDTGEVRTNRVNRDKNDSFRKGSNSFRENEKKSKSSFKRDASFKENTSNVDKVDKSRRTMWVPDKKVNGGLDRKQSFRKGREMAGYVVSSERKFKAIGKMVDRKEFVEMDSSHSISRMKFAERNLDSGKMFSQGWITSSGISNVKTWKKPDKKVRDDDSSLNEEQPRKRKRIRLDPHDTSNKRIGDGIVSGEKIKEKKDNLEKVDQISKNARFRAIEPSPSILSFVEDNFLGRRRLIELRRAGYNIEVPAPLDNNPSSTLERERIEENVFRNKLTFFAAAKVSSSFPPPELPEIAFAGRSNVGKSSLLNTLTRQWGVVRTSDKPGLTQTINFFKLGPKVCLVDLPGYGFAYAKEEVKDAWEELVKEYVSTRVGLRQVCLLIDTKWGMKPRDHELIDLMERFQTKYQIVLTKTDTIFPIDVARRAMQIQENLRAHKSMVKPVMMVSSKSGAGVQSLRKVLAKFTRFAKL